MDADKDSKKPGWLMARSGFTSAVLAEGQNLAAAERQFARYSAFYQGDALEPRPLFAREAA